jgi:hypothetical protein
MLPRLLYFSEVPLESTMFQGAGLVYRLLEGYPSEQLLVMETKPARAAPERRLPGVAYQEFPMRENRLRYTRASRLVGDLLIYRTSGQACKLGRAVEEFSPEAVLTVSFGYLWLVAARFAQTEKLPLHLILHDDWPPSMPVSQWLRKKQDGLFGEAYRYASSRLCVSPFMEEDYRLVYGAAGQVLYPSWSKETHITEDIPRAYCEHRKPLVGAYAGNIFRPGYTSLISSLAELLEKRGGRLLLFGPNSPEQMKAAGLNRNSVITRGVVSPSEIVSIVRAEADFVFVPMSFQSGSLQRNMRISFPSKLTDFTAAALPLLIWGPSYCSAVLWAQRHAPVAEVITSPALDELDAALERLEGAPHRKRLGIAAGQIGERLFSHRIAKQTFDSALLRVTEEREAAHT